MNSSKTYKLKTLLLLLVVSSTLSAQAQVGHRVYNFVKGEEYQTDVLTNSNAVVQRGKQKIDINSVSTLTKSYKVVDVNTNGYQFNASIKKMDNLIQTLGNQLHYNSSEKLDTGSLIKRSLHDMVNKSVDVYVDKYGVLQSSSRYKNEYATDTLVAFAGIQPEIFEKGTLFNLVADLTYDEDLKKGFTWTDSVTIDDQRLKTKFWIEEVNEKNMVVKFSSEIKSPLLNSNTNGTYVIENATGIITEKLLYIASTGYQISASKVMYAVSRATSISERTRKVSN